MQWSAQCEMTEIEPQHKINNFLIVVLLLYSVWRFRMNCNTFYLCSRFDSNAIGNRLLMSLPSSSTTTATNDRTVVKWLIIMRIRLNAEMLRQNVLFWSHAQIIKQWIRSGFSRVSWSVVVVFFSISSYTHNVYFHVFSVVLGLPTSEGNSSLQVALNAILIRIIRFHFCMHLSFDGTEKRISLTHSFTCSSSNTDKYM